MSKSNTNADLANLKVGSPLTPSASWDNVPVIDTDSLGGAGGPMNAQAQALANKFAYLEGVKGATKIGVSLDEEGVATRRVSDKLNDTINFKDFGAIGDGTTHFVSEWISSTGGSRFRSLAELQASYPHVTSPSDSIDWAAAQAAFNYANGKNVAVLATNGHYVIDKGVAGSGPVEFRTIGAAVEFLDGGFLFDSSTTPFIMPVSIENGYYSPKIHVGCKVVMPSSSHGYVQGDVVKLCGDDVYPWIKLTAKVGQCAVVAYVDGADVWLDRNIDTDVTYTKICKFSADKLVIDAAIINKSDAGAGGTLLYCRNYLSPLVNLRVAQSNYQACVMAGCYDADVNLEVSNIRDYNLAQTKWGYGVIDKNTEASRFNVRCRNIRHGYTTTHGGSGTTPDCYGQARDNIVTGIGIKCVTPFDTHASGENIRFVDALSIYPVGVGFANRSSNTEYSNCHSIGTSDSGWQNFDGEPSDITVGHNKRAKLVGCTSRGHKRGLKSVSNFQKDTGAHRFNVELIDCDFDADVYTDALFLRNTSLSYRNLTLRYRSSSSSVIEGGSWSESSPLFIRSFVSMINSEFAGSDLVLVMETSAQNIFPFAAKVDTSQNASARNVIATEGLFLDNSKTQQFTAFAELVVSLNLHGKKPSEGALDYTDGLDNTYIGIDGLKLYSKNISLLMRDDVLSFFYTKSTTTRTAFYFFNTANAPIFNPTYRLANDISFLSISTQSSNDFANAIRSVNLYGANEKNIVVRCLPITPSGQSGTAAIDISQILNPPGPEGTGMVLRIINERPTGTVKITASNVFPADTAAKGRGIVATLVYTGFGQWVRS